MGSGYNDSLAVGRGARNKATIRTPVYFWLSSPTYVYALSCGAKWGAKHVFRSRTPILTDGVAEPVFCERCSEYTDLPINVAPDNALISMDIYTDKRTKQLKGIAIEQDNGVIRERIARALQERGFLDTDADIAQAAVEFGVTVGEIKKINAGLSAADSGEPDMCRADLHEMSINNVGVDGHGRRYCKTCRTNAQRARRQTARSQ